LRKKHLLDVFGILSVKNCCLFCIDDGCVIFCVVDDGSFLKIVDGDDGDVVRNLFPTFSHLFFFAQRR